MKECLMQRAPYEKVVLNQTGREVHWICSIWNRVEHGVEVFATENMARDKYDAMKLSAALDYGFHIFMENLDEEG